MQAFVYLHLPCSLIHFQIIETPFPISIRIRVTIPHMGSIARNSKQMTRYSQKSISYANYKFTLVLSARCNTMQHIYSLPKSHHSQMEVR